jgi:hypothetical protein
MISININSYKSQVVILISEWWKKNKQSADWAERNYCKMRLREPSIQKMSNFTAHPYTSLLVHVQYF